VGAASGALKGNRFGNMLDGMLFRTTASGSARPVGRTTRDASGHICRRIEQSATRDGKTERDTVMFCKGAAGWAAAGTEEAKAPVTHDPPK
jgi:hypothetical protein